MDEIATISTLAIANGQFFGGGMRVAPLALPDDGQFDVVVMGDVPKRQALAQMKSIYAGEHLDHPAVRCVRGTKIVAVPVAETGGHPVLVEVDGESAGQLPATFEILPGALNLRC
jgi:diacylglycerol kinase family enzyme